MHDWISKYGNACSCQSPGENVSEEKSREARKNAASGNRPTTSLTLRPMAPNSPRLIFWFGRLFSRWLRIECQDAAICCWAARTWRVRPSRVVTERAKIFQRMMWMGQRELGGQSLHQDVAASVVYLLTLTCRPIREKVFVCSLTKLSIIFLKNFKS